MKRSTKTFSKIAEEKDDSNLNEDIFSDSDLEIYEDEQNIDIQGYSADEILDNEFEGKFNKILR